MAQNIHIMELHSWDLSHMIYLNKSYYSHPHSCNTILRYTNHRKAYNLTCDSSNIHYIVPICSVRCLINERYCHLAAPNRSFSTKFDWYNYNSKIIFYFNVENYVHFPLFNNKVLLFIFMIVHLKMDLYDSFKIRGSLRDTSYLACV